jgi:hypothetical protein
LAEFNERLSSPQNLISNIKDLEKSAHIKDELRQLERGIDLRKRGYNKIFHENKSREEKLEYLRRQSELLETR